MSFSDKENGEECPPAFSHLLLIEEEKLCGKLFILIQGLLGNGQIRLYWFDEKHFEYLGKILEKLGNSLISVIRCWF